MAEEIKLVWEEAAIGTVQPKGRKKPIKKGLTLKGSGPK